MRRRIERDNRFQLLLLFAGFLLLHMLVCFYTARVTNTLDTRMTALEERTTYLESAEASAESLCADLATLRTEMASYHSPESVAVATEIAEIAEIAAAAPTEPYYPLTDAERLLVECAVMSEARGECAEGQKMVAQCILDGAQRGGWDIATSFEKYRIYLTWDGEIYPEVAEAVSAVFDRGERVTEEKADLWYAYRSTTSAWHEKQHYVTTIGGHKFFWCSGEVS